MTFSSGGKAKQGAVEETPHSSRHHCSGVPRPLAHLSAAASISGSDLAKWNSESRFIYTYAFLLFGLEQSCQLKVNWPEFSSRSLHLVGSVVCVFKKCEVFCFLVR